MGTLQGDRLAPCSGVGLGYPLRWLPGSGQALVSVTLALSPVCCGVVVVRSGAAAAVMSARVDRGGADGDADAVRELFEDA